ncbi:DUF6286 domain-containing protein [Antrihabitans cavernicola]|uniref:DUF6286 domain-containing protein n=1 Tax=Antrihabitans cavernicola TaxID=2495913 RepID=A0A5A7S6P7_9NOCA|nr:DUF6286 domain-containing protein [Spelaeibacter cavernicola]KAA0018945.1 hypothetical protein FOY51_23190 [Spelaeibacter cavernicola]
MSVTDLDPSPAKKPAASPIAAPIATLTSLALITLSVIAFREFLIERGAVGGRPWIRNTFEWISRLGWQGWMLPAAIGAVIVGLLLLYTALAPRGRTHLAAKDSPELWLRPTDAARLSTAAALRVPGVLSAQTTVGKRVARISAVTDSTDSTTVAESVRSNVVGVLDGLDSPPRVKVSVHKGITQQTVVDQSLVEKEATA